MPKLRPFAPLRSFWFGLTLPVTAFRIIVASPLLIFWSALPITLTLFLYFYLITHLQAAAAGAVQQYFNSWGWNPQGWGAWILILLMKILLFVLSAFTFSAVASAVASPFNDFLAEKAERLSSPPLPLVKAGSLSRRARLIAIDVMKTVFATAMTWFAVMVSWIPALNVAALILAFLLVCFQYISYPQTRREQGIGQGLTFLLKHFFACLGFGAAFTFLFAIPIVASFAVPLAVVGGTLLFGRAQQSEKLFPLR